ncbi:MAG TPA: TolC family protein [Chitinophagaceae bacterium]|nr:TolC family protein [Chitinophagaceae bacterium]
MKMRIVILFLVLLAFNESFGQEKWGLQKCVTYALEHNITVRQTDLQARFSALTLKESKASQIPTLGVGLDAQYRWGLTENPTTGVLENNDYFSAGMGLQSGVTLFNWFSQRNTIKANQLTLQADNQQTNKVKDDIALNVANAYLQILLAKEQVNIARNQVNLSKSQLENTRKQVNAGKLPEINAAQLEAQLATDSATLIAVETTVTQSLLLMKALLTLDAATAFDVETPPVEMIPIIPLADLQPEAVYMLALANLSQQKVNDLRLQAAKKSVSAARGRMFPTITASGSIGSNYVDLGFPIYSPGPLQSTSALVTVGGVDYHVFAPTSGPKIGMGPPAPFGKQLRNNFGQTVGISLNVPLFNGLINRTNWERAKLTVTQYELTKQQGDIQLKQDIYNAYANAVAAVEKFNANKKAVQTTQNVLDFAQKRYDIGLLSTYDLITSQNNLQRAKYDLVYSQYDYVFKMKLLEFYRGQGLKL